MKKNIFVAFVAVLISAFAMAQVSTTPEVPRNYKPKPKELLPMPDSLTADAIFPVSGKYTVANKDGDSTNINITLDADSKGVVWINGLPEGKVKAILKGSPATYKIPSQRTFVNDAGMEETVEVNPNVETVAATGKKPAKKLSGKSVSEGTMIFDKDANAIYINLGSSFNEGNPSAVFETLKNTDDTNVTNTAATGKKAKKTGVKGKNYTGIKVIDAPVAAVQ